MKDNMHSAVDGILVVLIKNFVTMKQDSKTNRYAGKKQLGKGRAQFIRSKSIRVGKRILGKSIYAVLYLFIRM